MTKAVQVLHKVLVNYFYRVNAGFFLFIFFVLFGLPISPLAFHLSLITGIIGSQVFLAYVMLLWLLYNFKCVNYIVQQLNDQRHSFLFCINSLPLRKTYFGMLYVQVVVYMPVLLYSAAIVWLAFKNKQYWCLLEVILFHIIIVALTAKVYVRALQKRRLFINVQTPSLQLEIRKPLFTFPLFFLWHERKQMLFVTKLFSLLLLFGFFKLYEPQRFDIRPIQLCLLLTAASHSAVLYEIRSFEEEYVSFSRNLPVNIAGGFRRTVIMCSCLLLPEFIVLFKGLPLHFKFADFPQLIIQLISLLCLFYAVLLIEDVKTEQFFRTVFGIITGCFFVLLYNPGFILHAFVLVLAFALYYSYYYSYEKRL